MPLDYLASIQSILDAYNSKTFPPTAAEAMDLIAKLMKEHRDEEARVLEEQASREEVTL